MIDLTTACAETAGLLTAVHDSQLDRPTPCRDMNVAGLVAHLGQLAPAFVAAAGKRFDELTDTPPGPADLDADWRESYPSRLAELAVAWRDPAAWTGNTRAGGVDLPAEVAGLVAAAEVVVHGWDLARAAGLRYEPPPAVVEAILPHVTSFAEEPVEGLFEAPVPVPADSPVLTRVIALTGRDPHWRAADRDQHCLPSAAAGSSPDGSP